MATAHHLATLGLLAAMAACGPHGSGDDDDHPGRRDAGLDAPVDAGTDAPPEPPPIPAHCFAAAERGVGWLVAHQNFDGSWGHVNPVATTAFAVLKLETYARELGRSPFDPGFVHATVVARGFDYLMASAQTKALRPQPAGNPDSNGNGYGLSFSDLVYEDAVVLMALGGSGEPDHMVASAVSVVHGWTYRAVAQDLIDYLAFAQSDGTATTEFPCNRGGWRYSAFDLEPAAGDNSVSQWVTLGLEYARHPNYDFELTPPPWMVSELGRWVQCIQIRDGSGDDGASGYDAPDSGFFVNSYKTGALVQQLAFLGAQSTDPAPTAALAYLFRKWNDSSGAGWRGTPSDYLSMYSIMKGMESMALEDLDGIDWYTEFCNQLELEQHVDGSWTAGVWDNELVGDSGILSTVWALLVLERAAPPPEIIN